MAVDNFIPEIWAPELELEFHAAQIIIPTTNREYEGQVSSGNKVKITGAQTPSIIDYKAAGRVINPEDLNDDGIDLLIDQEKAFGFNVDDVNRAQAAGSLDGYTTAAGQALAEDAERYVAGLLLSQSRGLNITGSSPVTVDTPAKARTALLAIRTYLNQQKLPQSQRFAAVNPAFASLLIDQLSDASYAGGDTELRNGVIGRIYGMTVLESPILGNQALPTAVGYHSMGVAFASQITEVEALRNPNKFADIVRGLNVYGARVIRQNLVASYVSGGVSQNAVNTFLS